MKIDSLDDIEVYSKKENSELEKFVIGYICKIDHTLISKVKRDYFTSKILKTMYDAVNVSKSRLNYEMMKTYFVKKYEDEESVELALTTVKKVLKNKELKITDRQMIDGMIELLNKHYMLRQSMEFTYRLVDHIKESDIEKIKKETKNFLALDDNNSIIDSGEFLEDFEERYNSLLYLRENPDVFGCKTGIDAIDNVIGVLKPAEFGIVMGASGIGKSILVENFAINNWFFFNKNVLFISLEMPKLQVQNRADAYITGLMYKYFRTGEITDKNLKVWKKKIEDLKRNFENKFHISYMKRSTCADEMMAEAYRIQDKMKSPFDLVVVDYLNLMRPNGSSKASKTWESMSDVSWDLKCFAQDFNNVGVPLWTPNQMKSDGTIKYGGAIKEHCPLVLRISQDEDDELEEVVWIEFDKTRDTENVEPIKIVPALDFMRMSSEDFNRYDNRSIVEKING